LTSGRPVPWFVLFSEVDEEVGNIGVVINEAMVEIGKTEEETDSFDSGGSRPGSNSV
jgi:hypothetical protein